MEGAQNSNNCAADEHFVLWVNLSYIILFKGQWSLHKIRTVKVILVWELHVCDNQCR